MEVFVKVDEWLGKFGLSTYTLFIACGLVLMLYYVIRVLEKENNYSRERTNRILLWLLISLGVAYLFAWFFDALFHFFESGKFEGGMTYISGMLGGVGAFSIMTYFFNRDERGNILRLLHLIIPGVILAHAFGRIGCFPSAATERNIGVFSGRNWLTWIAAPCASDSHEAFSSLRSFSESEKSHSKKAFAYYLIIYGVFGNPNLFRGDNRGLLFNLPRLLF